MVAVGEFSRRVPKFIGDVAVAAEERSREEAERLVPLATTSNMQIASALRDVSRPHDAVTTVNFIIGRFGSERGVGPEAAPPRFTRARGAVPTPLQLAAAGEHR
jgi:hypothetical protein